MERPAERITLARTTAKNLPGGGNRLPPGLQPAALEELRSAAATYDYLRSTGDPVEFWETLRIARNRRGLPPVEGGAVAVPDAAAEAALLKELESVRGRFADLVGELREFLKETPSLPEPTERLEMALAFLMASSREHEAVAAWLREPEKHRARAADKIRSLAGITDPYRDALRPWSLVA